VPKSLQSKGNFAAYRERIQAVARTRFTAPVTEAVEVDILFRDHDARPDVDNVAKTIIDALKGVAIPDDRQVRRVAIGVIDDAIVQMTENHLTFQQVVAGDAFLVIVRINPPRPSVLDVPSS